MAEGLGLSWKDALEQGFVYTVVDGATKLGFVMSELGAEYDELIEGETVHRAIASRSTVRVPLRRYTWW